MSGRTSWFARDAAWHRRELIVELGEEFGPDGPFVMDVLCAWAQEQRSGGMVRGGFRTLARESFVTVSHAQSIVARAAAIGALDDLELDDDGRRFHCRVSGWKADQERGRAAARQENRRNSEKQESPPVTPCHAESRSVTASALPDHTEVKEGGSARASGLIASIVDDTIAVLRQCERIHIDRVGIENAIVSWPGRDPVRAAREVVTWVTDPAFNGTNGARLLVRALEKQQPATGDTKAERTERRLASLRALDGGAA